MSSTTPRGKQMDSLEKIQQQIKELQEKANELISQKKAEVLAEVIKNIRTYGLTAEECGFSLTAATYSKPKKTTQTSKSKAEPQYRGPNGEEWAGGRGAKPKWIKEILEAGGNIEDYRISKED